MTATVWREGHDAVAATVVWKGPGDRTARSVRMEPHGAPGLDRFAAVVVPDAVGTWTFRVDAWGDPWATWLHAIEKKVAAGQDADELANDLEVGARVLDASPDRRSRSLLLRAAAALRDTTLALDERIAPALSEPVLAVMHDNPVRELVTKGTPQKLWVDRERAAFGSWYEFFPRSTGGVDADGQPSTAPSRRPRRCSTAPPAWASTSSTCRRSTRSAGSTARAATTRSTRAGRRRLAVGHRRRGGRPRRRPPGPGHDRRLRRLRRPRPRARPGGRARPGPAGRARPPVGPASTPSTSPCCPTAPSPTPRTRRRSTRTSTRSTSTTRRAIYAEVLRVVRFWVDHGCASSGSTTRTPSRRASGPG